MASTTRIGSITVAPTPPDCPFMGDEWWNSTNGQLFVYYDDGDTRQWVVANRSGPVVAGGGGSSVTTSDTPPASPRDGDLWWDSTGGKLFVWYDDGNSSQWVPATSTTVGPVGPAGPAGPVGPAGLPGNVATLGVVTPVTYGALGDGVTDDTAAMQAAISAAAGKTLDGAGLTYRLRLPLTGVASNTTIRNATFDFSTMPSQPGTNYCLNMVGSVGANMPLTSDTLASSNIVNIASTTSLAADDLVYFTSSTLIDTSSGAIFGQYGRVKAVVSATQFTTVTAVAVSFLVSAAAVVKRVTAVSGVTIRDCQFIGAGINAQIALLADWTENFRLLHNRFLSFDRAALTLSRSYKPIVDGNYARKAVLAGFAYGFTVGGGCYHAHLVNNIGEDVRHTVTLGGTTGISLHTMVVGNHAINSKDAGFDSHPSAMFTTFANNVVEMSAEIFGTSNHEGMISQSGHTTFIGNTIYSAQGGSIMYQPTVVAGNGVAASVIIVGNKVVMSENGASSTGIMVDMHATLTPDIEKILITDNQVSGNPSHISYGIYVQNKRSGARIKSLIVARNQVSDISNYATYIRALTGAIIERLEVSDNDLDTTTTRALYITAEGAGSTISCVTGSGNILKSSSVGLGLFTATGAVIGPGWLGPNVYRSIADNLTVQVTGPGMAGVLLRDAIDANTVAFTNAAISIVAYTNWYTFGRSTAQIVTLPDPTLWRNTELNFRSVQAGSLDSATANVTPIAGGAAVTAIFPASGAGKWAVLRSDGTTWRIVKAN